MVVVPKISGHWTQIKDHQANCRIEREVIMRAITIWGATFFMAVGFLNSSVVPQTSAEDTAAPSASTEATGAAGKETGSPPDAGEVQERAVIRDHRTQQQLKQAAPAAKPTDKSSIGIFQPGMQITPTPTAPSTGGTGPLPVVGGITEPDYKYPWVVRLGSFSCGGVLIDPQWVLTAAHCVTPQIGFSKVTYNRMDPYTGAVKTETRGPSQNVGPTNNRGVFIHPEFNKPSPVDNDIALIKLAQPFTISPYIQTVGLPRTPRSAGMVGTVASISHTGPLPAGQVSVLKGPISAIASPTKIIVTAAAAMASLCKGDSGSGFVTFENGRAIVRGTTSEATITDCMTPSGEAVFSDVFVYRGWILQTMGKSDASLAGNTRVRWSGRGARGVMGIGCINPYETMWGPLNVVGVEVGAECEAGQTQTIMCNLDKNQGGTVSTTPSLAGLTMRTTMPGSVPDVRSIAPSSSGNTASFFGPLPAGASREFICQIATPLTSGTIGNLGGTTAVLSRGVEGESTEEATIVQPSPFEPLEESKP